MKNELETHIDNFKSTYETLPDNTKSARKKKMEFVTEELEENKKRIEKIENELQERIKKIKSIPENPKIKEVANKLEKCKVSNEWNEYNTCYEKMHLDYYLYQLVNNYKDDLNGVNECLKKILDSFKSVNIIIKKDDFDFSTYASQYMELVIDNSTDEVLKKSFEEIYWKFPDLIKTIEINIRSIYNRNESKINKYYQDRKNDFLKSIDSKDLLSIKMELNKEYKSLLHKDKYTNFAKFSNGVYSLGTFNEAAIKGKINTYFGDGTYEYEDLISLSEVMFEYNIFIKYKYLLDDMSKRLEKKEEYKSARSNALKKITASEKKLQDLSGVKKKFKLFRKNDEKWLFKYKEALNNVINDYSTFDDDSFNDLIYTNLSQDCSILEVMKLIVSNYVYFVTKSLEYDERRTIDDIDEEFNELNEDINNKEYSLLNNLVLMESYDVKTIISDRYKLEGINIPVEMLEEDGVNKILDDITTLIRYEDIKESGIDLQDVELYLDFMKLTDGK